MGRVVYAPPREPRAAENAHPGPSDSYYGLFDQLWAMLGAAIVAATRVPCDATCPACIRNAANMPRHTPYAPRTPVASAAETTHTNTIKSIKVAFPASLFSESARFKSAPTPTHSDKKPQIPKQLSANSAKKPLINLVRLLQSLHHPTSGSRSRS